MKAEGPARHATYVPHPEASSYTNYLLTLLAQRRELQSGPLCHALNAGGSSSLPPHIFMAPATAAHVDRERADLQHEVCLQPQAAGVGAPAASISPATALTDAVQRVASPLAGMSEVHGLWWHFRGRAACLEVEQQELQRHLAALHATHLQHRAADALHRARFPSQGVTGAAGAVAGAQLLLPPAPPPTPGTGRCSCEAQIRAAGRSLEALQRAQVDVAERAARLGAAAASGSSAVGKAAVTEADLLAVVGHVVSVGPPGRLAQRLFDRLLLLPLSHHHRFPIYEQVCERGLQRDQQMAACGLRVPPRVIRLASEALATVEVLLGSFPEVGELLGKAGSSERQDGGQDWDLVQQQRHLYLARKLLPRMVQRMQAMWPMAHAAPPEPADSQSAGGQGEQAELAAAHTTPAASKPPVILDCLTGPLQGLAPSCSGDLSAGHTACLRAMGLQVDGVLRAENAFLGNLDLHQVRDRLRTLAAAHATRWSVEEVGEQQGPGTTPAPGPGSGPLSPARLNPGGVLSTFTLYSARQQRQLEERELEALYLLRWMKTARDRLRVLHLINAATSLQVALLRDEAQEQAAGLQEPCTPQAAKPLTCPLSFAGASSQAGAAAGSGIAGSEAAGAAGEGQGPAPLDQGTSEGGELAGGLRDTLCADPDAAVAVMDGQGRRVVYRAALHTFHALEEELLRLASRNLDAYAHQLHAAGREEEVQELDRLAVLEDLWHHEAAFASARHALLLAQFAAYRHATDYGFEDAFAGLDRGSLPDAPRPFPGTSAPPPGTDPWQGQAANSRQPALLPARQQLRREMVDVCFRRPSLALEDGYFV
ncbi:hypothetical protein V8C86DRAFT_2604829, partial [Haematococcus lacustris]